MPKHPDTVKVDLDFVAYVEQKWCLVHDPTLASQPRDLVLQKQRDAT